MKETVGKRIRTFRELRNMPIKEMANHLSMTPQGYAKIEKGEVSITTDKLQQISDILDVPLSDLINQEKFVFNIENNQITGGGHGYNVNNFPVELKAMYDDKIALLEGIVRDKDTEIAFLRGQMSR